MPPRTALLELATRRNSYVCRSCLASLGITPATQRFERGLAKISKNEHASRSTKTSKPITSPKEVSQPERARDQDLTVRYFEKDPITGSVTRVQDEDDGEDEPDFEDLEELQASAMAKMDKLEEMLPKFERMTGLLERILEKHGPPGSLEALHETLKSYDEDDGGESSNEKAWGLPRIQFSGTGVPRNRLARLEDAAALLHKHLNFSIEALKENRLHRKHLTYTWKYFEKLSKNIPRPYTTVPKEVWDALWTILSFKGPQNLDRMFYIRHLSGIMRTAGVTLSDEQQLLALEAAFESNRQEAALNEWARLVTEMGDKSLATANAYWELGVRMWSAHGDTERAERAGRALFERSSPSNPVDSRVLLHLVAAYCRSPDTAERGFKLYRRMRDLATKIGKPMEIGDYDDVISIFLGHGHTDYAMFSFIDMMFAGTVNLYGRSKLPSTLKNTFFFGKWLKRLIGAGDLDGAYKVLAFMQRNGVMAASIQVNGLLGAWVRSGEALYTQKAESLGWAMIRSRKSFVDLRKRQATSEWPMKLVDNRPNRTEHEGADLDYTMVPRATVETFVLLAENYRSRGLFGRLEQLFVAYKECAMPGDAMMMNELMLSAVAQNRGDKAREMYNLMVHENDLLPNVDTFAILFRSLPVHQGPRQLLNADVHAHSSREARKVFREMLANSWLYAGHFRANRGNLSENQVKVILHSFRKANDWPGVVAAVEGLRDIMKYQLTRAVLLEMLAEQEGLDRPSPRMGRLVLRATTKLHVWVEKMKERGYLTADGLPVEGVKEPQVLYQILQNYYYNKVQESFPAKDGEAGQVIERAKEEMGVTSTVKIKAHKEQRKASKAQQKANNAWQKAKNEDDGVRK